MNYSEKRNIELNSTSLMKIIECLQYLGRERIKLREKDEKTLQFGQIFCLNSKKKKKKKNTGQDVSHYVQNKLLTDIVLKDTMKSSMKSMKSSKNSFHVITADEYIDV